VVVRSVHFLPTGRSRAAGQDPPRADQQPGAGSAPRRRPHRRLAATISCITSSRTSAQVRGCRRGRNPENPLDGGDGRGRVIPEFSGSCGALPAIDN
jgi:hypothetical protein